MGLDIYFAIIPNKKEYDKKYKVYEEKSDQIWKDICGDEKYETLSEEKKEECRKKTRELEAEMDLGDFGANKQEEDIREPSKLYPDHLCKIGYLRSSYNEGGFDRVCRQMINKDLYWIFGKDNDDYMFQPNWQETLTRAQQVKEELLEKIKESNGHRVMCIDSFIGSNFISSENEAMDLFTKELNKKRYFDNYECIAGYFHMKDPIKVKAFIWGKNKILGERNCLYVVYETDEESGLDWYLQMADIIIENCKYVLSLPNKDNVYLAWSS